MSDLQNLGASPKERILVQSLGLKNSVGGSELNGVLEQGSTLTRKHGFVDNGGSVDKQHVTSNTAVLLCTAHGDEVAGEKFVGLDFNPLAETEDPDIIRLDAHSAELVEGALALPHHSALESNEHEQGKERVVPVLVEHPKSDTEDLEDKERCDGVLLEQLSESRNGDIERVGAIVMLEAGQVRLLLDTARRLEMADGGLGLGVDVVLEGTEILRLGVVQESPLLEQERDVGLATSLKICLSAVCLLPCVGGGVNNQPCHERSCTLRRNRRWR